MADMYQLKQVPSTAQIRKFIRRTVFGKNIYCPACKSRKVYAVQGRYRCRSCKIRFSLFSHTWLANLKLSLQKFWLVLWCWTAQIPVRQAMALTKLSEVTIRHWYDIFRWQLPDDQETLEKVVQLDEVYFGGRKGKALFMAKQVGTRKIAYHLVDHPHPVREDAWWFLKTNIKPRSTLQTDGAGIYERIDYWWPITHKKEVHRRWEFELTSEIEGVFGNLRTFIRRMYHHVTVDKLPELVGEFCYRFSHPEMFENPRFYLQKTLRLVPTR